MYKRQTFHFFSQTPEGHYQYRWSGRLPDGLLSFPVCNARAAWNGEKMCIRDRHKVETVVLDEADRMLDMGFIKDVTHLSLIHI